MLAPYAAALKSPHAGATVTASMLGRLPAGVLPLALVLLVQRATGSLAAAGLVVGAFAIATGVSAPARARLVDRHGPRRTMPTMAVLQGLGLTWIVAAAGLGWYAASLIPGAVLAGAASPPVQAVVRAMWGRLLVDDALAAAYAWEAVSQEIVFIAGPALVGVVLVIGGTPSTIVVAAAGLSLTAGSMIGLSHVARRIPPRIDSTRLMSLEALSTRGMRTLVASVAPYGIALGAIEVAVPAFVSERGDPAAAGFVLAAFGAGSVAGGLLYGARRWRDRPGRRYVFLSAALFVSLAPLPLATSIPGLTALVVVGGLVFAPITACAFSLLDEIAPPRMSAEPLTWLGTSQWCGAALGAAAAGWIANSSGAQAALALVPLGTLLSALIAGVGIRALMPPVDEPASRRADAVAGIGVGDAG